MKKKCMLIYFLFVAVFSTIESHAQSFELVSLPGGSEGINTDISPIDIGEMRLGLTLTSLPTHRQARR